MLQCLFISKHIYDRLICREVDCFKYLVLLIFHDFITKKQLDNYKRQQGVETAWLTIQMTVSMFRLTGYSYFTHTSTVPEVELLCRVLRQ